MEGFGLASQCGLKNNRFEKKLTSYKPYERFGFVIFPCFDRERILMRRLLNNLRVETFVMGCDLVEYKSVMVL